MIVVSGVVLAAILVVAGLLHLMWAFGSYWPAKSERDLAERVLPDPDQVPSAPLTAVVAAALLGAAYIALAMVWEGLRFVPDWMYVAATWAIAGAFALRTLEPLFVRDPTPLYDRLNKRFYSPLCVVLAALAAVVAVAA